MGEWQGTLEVVGMILFADIFRGRKIVVTGHTGFKGSWLTLWLRQLGANVTGISLPPDTQPSHWNLLNTAHVSHNADINNLPQIKKLMQAAQPELVIHLAAQPLVRSSYAQPLLTWQTNVMGTANVLEACRELTSLRGILVITTDKVYENHEDGVAFVEADSLGGYDPYSASKAACELVVQSYRRSFFSLKGVLLASARAGNVIGGGDWASDRLIPDIIRSMHEQSPLIIRNPFAVRPWQHVLDSLSGYLCLAHRLLMGDKDKAVAWNFGPDSTQRKTVEDLLVQMKIHWPSLAWCENSSSQVHEAEQLRLDSAAARLHLGWQPIWGFEKTARYTAEWYQHFYFNQELMSQRQLDDYISDAVASGAAWANNKL